MVDRLPIVVTGATGFLGRAVLRQLADLELPIRALAHRAEAVIPNTRAEWHVGDIRDATLWDRLLPGAGAIIHLASAGVTNLSAVRENVETNLPAFVTLMQSAGKYRLGRIVLAGSCFEYGRVGERITDRGLREDDPLLPTNAYAASKACITLLAAPLSEEIGIDTVVIRPFHVYGPDEPAGRLIPSVLAMARSGGAVNTTKGEQVRDFVHQDDVARALIAAATRPKIADANERFSIFNVGTGVPTMVADVIQRLVALCGVDAQRVHLGAVPYRNQEMKRLVADPSRAQALLGWSARISLQQGLEGLVAQSRP